MNLDEAQKQKVVEWIAEGLKLNDIQARLAKELGVSLTYLEVRFLIDDLKLRPKDPELPKPASDPLAKPAAGAGAPSDPTQPQLEELSEEEASAFGGVSVKVDQVTRPGAVVSGKVTFSDGKSADWYLDQYGRLGLASKEQGYKPSQSDLMAFQNELQNELARQGF